MIAKMSGIIFKTNNNYAEKSENLRPFIISACSIYPFNMIQDIHNLTNEEHLVLVQFSNISLALKCFLIQFIEIKIRVRL